MGVILLDQSSQEPDKQPETAALPPTYLKALVDRVNATPVKTLTRLGYNLQMQAGGAGIVLQPYQKNMVQVAAKLQVLLGTLQECGIVLEAAMSLAMQCVAAFAQKGLHSPVRMNMRNINPPQQEAINALLALGLPPECVHYISGPETQGADDANGTTARDS